MGKPSKERIVEALYETPEFKSLIVESKERLISTKVIKFEGHYSESDKSSSIRVVLETEYMGNKKIENTNNKYINPAWWSIPRHLLFDQSSLKAVFKANFGILKPGSTKKYLVPTFNVKYETAKDEFLRKAEAHLSTLLVNETQSESKRISDEIAAFCITPEADQMRQEAADRFTIDTIKSVLLRFKDARPEILKQAMDEFVCHAITEF